MAGLIDYLMMGLGVSGIYIGVKYGPQIIQNLQQPATARTQQPSDSSTPTTSTSTSTPTTPTDEIGQPVGITRHRHVRCGPGQMVNRAGQCVANTDQPYVPPPPAHQNDTGTYPTSTQRRAASIPSAAHQPPIPAGIKETVGTNPYYPAPSHAIPSPDIKPKRSLTPVMTDQEAEAIARTITPIDPASVNKPNAHCICLNGKYRGPGCNMTGESCFESNIGYWNGYNIPVTGPQWYKSIPYNQVVASVGVMTKPTGRVNRALAANNHQFTPSGFVLSEASVRRGFNNAYSAGT